MTTTNEGEIVLRWQQNARSQNSLFMENVSRAERLVVYSVQNYCSIEQNNLAYSGASIQNITSMGAADISNKSFA